MSRHNPKFDIMKRVILLLAVLALGMSPASAMNETETIIGDNVTSRYNYNRPIAFKERGIVFFVFQNGEFDFNTHHGNRRGGINTTYGTNYHHPRGVKVQYDHFGRVRRVGNVFINYDANGRVKRIGKVYMRYRFRKLTQVGGKRLIYNRFGRLIRTVGAVKANVPCGYCNNHGCTIDHYGHADHDHGYPADGDWDDDHWDDDDWGGDDGDILYFKNQDTKKKKDKR